MFSWKQALTACALASPTAWASHAAPVHDVQRLLGYGGAIPHFQSYLITGNREHLELARIDLEQAIKITEQQSADNLYAQRLLVTLQAYQSALPYAQNLKEQGKAAPDILARLPISEAEAISALSYWHNDWAMDERERQTNATLVAAAAVILIIALLTLLYRRRDYRQLVSQAIQDRRLFTHFDRTVTSLTDLKDTDGLGFFEIQGQTVAYASSAAQLMRADKPPTNIEELTGLFPAPYDNQFAMAIHQASQFKLSKTLDIKSPPNTWRITLEPIADTPHMLGLIQLLVPVSRKELENAQQTTLQIAFNRAARIKRLTSGLRQAKEQLTSLEKAAHKDPLTDLYNRLGFGERLRAEVQRARRKDQTLGVLMVDVDRFKVINDTYGHAVGDQALKLIADTLQRLVRSEGGDIVGRLGGDEFIVVLADASAEHANRTLKMARTLLASESIPQCPDESVRVDISGGAVTLNPTKDEPGEVIKLADAALYRAKEKRPAQA